MRMYGLLAMTDTTFLDATIITKQDFSPQLRTKSDSFLNHMHSYLTV